MRLKPIADAKDTKNKCDSGERHWETTHGATNRFVMSLTFQERVGATKVRRQEKAKAKSKAPGLEECKKRKLQVAEKGGSKTKQQKL